MVDCIPAEAQRAVLARLRKQHQCLGDLLAALDAETQPLGDRHASWLAAHAPLMDQVATSLDQLQVLLTQQGGLPERPSWLSLPPELLAAILRPSLVDNQARLVCRQFRDTHDAGLRRVTLSPGADHSMAGLVASLERTAARLPHLQAIALDLSDVTLRSAWDMQELGSALHNVAAPLPVPLELDFREPPEAPWFAAYLAAALSTCRCLAQLRALRICGSEDTNEARARQLGAALLQATHLTALEVLALTNGAVTSEGAKRLAAGLLAATHLASLKELNFRGSAMHYGVAAVCDLLNVATHLSSLTALDLCTSAAKTFQDVQGLAHALCTASHLASLQHLSLECLQGLDNPSAEALARALRAATHLTALASLRLAGGFAGPQGASQLASALASSSHLCSLQAIELSEATPLSLDQDARGGPQLLAALASATHLSRLQQLQLSGYFMGASGGVQLAALLAATHVGGLHGLNLSGTNLSGSGIAQLAQALAAATHIRWLQALDLSGSCLALLPDVQALSRALVSATHLRSLTELNVGCNQFGPQGAAAFVAAMAAATHLSNLRTMGQVVCERMLGPHELAGLVQEASHLSRLTELHLNSFRGFGARELQLGLRALACLPHLQVLHLFWRSDRAAADAATALVGATQLTGLRELAVYLSNMVALTGMDALCGALQAAAHLRSLHVLSLQHVAPVGRDAGVAHSAERLAAALHAATHLSGLRTLDLTGFCALSCAGHVLLEAALRASHFRGVRLRLEDECIAEMMREVNWSSTSSSSEEEEDDDDDDMASSADISKTESEEM